MAPQSSARGLQGIESSGRKGGKSSGAVREGSRPKAASKVRRSPSGTSRFALGRRGGRSQPGGGTQARRDPEGCSGKVEAAGVARGATPTGKSRVRTGKARVAKRGRTLSSAGSTVLVAGSRVPVAGCPVPGGSWMTWRVTVNGPPSASGP